MTIHKKSNSFYTAKYWIWCKIFALLFSTKHSIKRAMFFHVDKSIYLIVKIFVFFSIHLTE